MMVALPPKEQLPEQQQPRLPGSPPVTPSRSPCKLENEAAEKIETVPPSSSREPAMVAAPAEAEGSGSGEEAAGGDVDVDDKVADDKPQEADDAQPCARGPALPPAPPEGTRLYQGWGLRQPARVLFATHVRAPPLPSHPSHKEVTVCASPETLCPFVR